jgi:hypothetical protein
MNNNPCIVFAVEGNRLLVDIQRVSANTCSPANDYLYQPWHLSEFVCDFHNLSAYTSSCTQSSLQRCDVFPTLSQSLPQYSCTSYQRSQLLLYHYQRSQLLLYQSPEIPVTLKACQIALLGSNTVLKLTLLSLHSTSSQILLESSRD